MRREIIEITGAAAVMAACGPAALAAEPHRLFANPFGSYQGACTDYASTIDAACPSPAPGQPFAALFQQTRILIREKRAVDTGQECNYVWVRVRCE